jgi:hypothetical protein
MMNGTRPFAAGHQPELGGLIDDHVHAEHGEIDVEDLHDRPRPGESRADTDADHAGLGDRRVAHPAGAIFGQQPFRHLVGAAAFGDALADDEDFRVARHFFVDGLAKRVPVHNFPIGHALLPSGEISNWRRIL